jgi:phycocyanin beta chain
MLDAFGKVVAQADARGEYISSAQFDALSKLASEGNKRLDAVQGITANAATIVSSAARSLFAEQPQLIAPGGNAYTNRRVAACLRDLEIVLRYITYATLAGDSSVLDDRCLNGLRETYQALGVPGSSVAVAIQKMKDASISVVNDPSGVTVGDCSALASEVASYFDRAAAAVV